MQMVRARMYILSGSSKARALILIRLSDYSPRRGAARAADGDVFSRERERASER